MSNDTAVKPKSYDLRIVVDDSALQDALAELKSYLSGNAIELPESISQLATVNLDSGTATGAGELRIILKPSNTLLEFMSAARIGTRNG